MNSNAKRCRRGFLLTLCLAGIMVTASGTRADVIERVVAVVNNKPIFLSELRAKAAPFLSQIANAPNDQQRAARLGEAYQQLLGVLINEELLRQLAVADSIHITDEQIDRTIENQQKQYGVSDEEYWDLVREEGLTVAQHRRSLRGQLERFEVMNRRVRSRVNVTEEDARRAYEKRAKAASTRDRFRASHILFPVDEDASATTVASVRAEAEKVRAELTADNFPQTMARIGGGDLGWLERGDLPPNFESELVQLKRGDISAPIRGSAGFHIFFVREREGGDSFPSFEELKPEIMDEMLNKAMQRQADVFLEELRRKATIREML